MSAVVVAAPFAGWVSALAEVPDAVFAGGMMGDGVALDPLDGVLRAPCAAEVVAVAATGHAVTLRLANGAELLLHIGIDTVALGGDGFAAHVAVGARVAAGDPLVAVDLDRVAARAASLVTPVVVVNDGFRVAAAGLDRLVAAGAPLFSVHAGDVAARAATVPATSRSNRGVVVRLAHGIHARPAARIAAALKPFAADVAVVFAGTEANARSTSALLALGVGFGATIEVGATGTDAAAAVAAVVALIASGMDEAGPSVPAPPPDRGGIGASPGLAIGPVFQFRAGDLAVERDADDPAAEQIRLTDARRLAAERLGEGGVDVAHHALLDDPELVAAASAAIDAGRSAGFAWRGVIAAVAARFRATGNTRLIERIDDLADVERQVLTALGGDFAMPVVPDGAIVVAEVVLPSQFAAFGRIAGLCTAAGGPTSHVAILAASAGVPMVVAAGPAVLAVADGCIAVLDAAAGLLDASPTPARLAAVEAEIAARRDRVAADIDRAADDCRLADGARIEVFANIASVAEAAQAVAAGAEGCGLLRTELLFLDRDAAPSVDEQAAEYQRIADALGGRPLIVRTLDIGGDKPVPYLPFAPEDNPALGQRGIRLGLARPDLLRDQLRAILRVAPACRIMVPMVVDLGELRAVRAALDALGPSPIQLGVMIETPAAALLADQLAAEADFLSIGTNDLTQYALAADRGNPATAAMIDALHPAVLRLVAAAAAGARAHRRPLGVCGAAASDPLAAAILVGLGVDELSAAPAAVPAVKALLRQLTRDTCTTLAIAALAATSPAAVRRLAADTLGDAL